MWQPQRQQRQQRQQQSSARGERDDRSRSIRQEAERRRDEEVIQRYMVEIRKERGLPDPRRGGRNWGGKKKDEKKGGEGKKEEEEKKKVTPAGVNADSVLAPVHAGIAKPRNAKQRRWDKFKQKTKEKKAAAAAQLAIEETGEDIDTDHPLALRAAAATACDGAARGIDDTEGCIAGSVDSASKRADLSHPYLAMV